MSIYENLAIGRKTTLGWLKTAAFRELAAAHRLGLDGSCCSTIISRLPASLAENNRRLCGNAHLKSGFGMADGLYACSQTFVSSLFV